MVAFISVCDVHVSLVLVSFTIYFFSTTTCFSSLTRSLSLLLSRWSEKSFLPVVVVVVFFLLFTFLYSYSDDDVFILPKEISKKNK